MSIKGRRAISSVTPPPLEHPVVAVEEGPQITLDDSQAKAMRAVRDFLHPKQDFVREFRLGGYAGTGKTTLIKEILKEAEIYPAIAAFTGKAVSVLRSKGLWGALTLHSLMYLPRNNPSAGKAGVSFMLKPELGCSTVIVDEASMVSKELYTDLMSFGIKVLWVGDPGQLEPVGDDIGLMKKPDIVLTQIHRQAANSPILLLADDIRKGKNIPETIRKAQCELIKVVPGGAALKRHIMEVDQVICGFNKTRDHLNKVMREYKGYAPKPVVVGEKIICLQNNQDLGVFNGQVMYVDELRPQAYDGLRYTCTLHDDLGAVRTIDIRFIDPKEELWKQKTRSRSLKYALVDYAYCLTCHKVQGSEAPRILVINESRCKLWQASRWMYTALTRASQEVRVVL